MVIYNADQYVKEFSFNSYLLQALKQQGKPYQFGGVAQYSKYRFIAIIVE